MRSHRIATPSRGRCAALALALYACVGAAFATDYVERHALQVAGTLDIHWELISGPQGAPVGCAGIEFTDGTLADAADGTVTMSGVGVSIGGCIGLDSYNFTMAPDGLSLSGFASTVAMTLTRAPGEAAFVGDWVASGHVFRAHVAADPFPIPDYDPTWLGAWMGEWIDLNDPEFLGAVELVVEQSSPAGPGTVLAGTLDFDCLFGDECGATQQFTATESGGVAELDAANLGGVENFVDGQYEFTRSADGLSLSGERLDDPDGREIRLTLHRVAAVAIPSESPSIQKAVDDFAARPVALRFELAPGGYAETVSLAALAGRSARSDLVGTGITPDLVVLDDGVVGVNASMLATDGAGSDGLLVIENLTVLGGETYDSSGAGFVASSGDRAIVVRGCVLRDNHSYDSGVNSYELRRGANATVEPGARARFDATMMSGGTSPLGGGLFVNGGDVVVVDCELANNSASGDGGGVVLYTEFLTGGQERASFLRTRFTGNVGTSTGGAMFNGGYAHVVIEDCEFADNVATQHYANGGAINSVAPATFTLRGTSFVRNVAGDSGGALNLSGQGTHLIENCTFGGAPGDGNFAAYLGGAIVIRAPYTGYVFDVALVNNAYQDNEASYGGALALAETFSGGSPPPNPPFPGVRINVTLSNEDFDDNRATYWGGAVYAERHAMDSGDLEFFGCDFRSNSANIGGALFRNSGGPTRIQGGVFHGNAALDSQSGGGGVYLQLNSIELSGVDFRSNTAQFGAGVLLIGGAGSTIDGCRFGAQFGEGNVAAASGGALYLQPDATPSAKTGEGARTPRLVALRARADGTDLAFRPAGKRSALGDPVTLSDCIVEGNAAQFGGGLVHVGNVAEDADVVLERVDFLYNTADFGAAVYVLGFDDELAATAVEFRGNTARYRGGAVAIENGAARLRNALFVSNQVTRDGSGVSGPFGGGAVHVGATDAAHPGSAAFVHCTLAQNFVAGAAGADVGGAGILVSGSATIHNSILHGNLGPSPSVEQRQIKLDPSSPIVATAELRSTLVQGFDALAGNLGPGPVFGFDPQFVFPGFGDFRLAPSSLAIDAGDAALLPSDLTVDLDGNPRYVNVGVDLGAYEYGVVTAVDDGPLVPNERGRLAAHPNPFNPRLTISFALDRAADLRVTIFDVRGQRVRTLEEGPRGPGEHRLTWDGTDAAGRRAASGSYLVELRADDRREVRRVALVR